MGQSETAVQRDTATGVLSPAFAPVGQLPETLQTGPTVTSASETLRWSELSYRDQTFVLNKELLISVVQEESGWSFESKEYGLLGFGHTRSEAELAFRFDFFVCWNEMACEDDEILSRRARELKQTFMGLVNSVK
jgi:hypothetical protein